MSTAEILAEIPKLSSADRLRVLDRLLELDDEALAVEAARRTADEAFQILDRMEEFQTVRAKLSELLHLA